MLSRKTFISAKFLEQEKRIESPGPELKGTVRKRNVIVTLNETVQKPARNMCGSLGAASKRDGGTAREKGAAGSLSC